MNLGMQVVVSGVALMCVPGIVRNLGAEQFGLLSILWLFVGYFGMLDFGVGYALVKFLSEHFSKGNRLEAAGVFHVATKMSVMLSLAWVATVIVISFIGVEHFLNISPELRVAAGRALLVLALCIPAVLLQGALRSILIAKRRFDILNIIQGASGTVQWGGSLVVLMLKGGLMEVVALTMFIRYISLFATYLHARKLFPEAFDGNSSPASVDTTRLMKFGGWITISQITGPVVVFLERLFIGNILSLAWLSYFTVPSDAVAKLLVIPMSLASTLLPSLSGSWWNHESRVGAERTYGKAIKFTYLFLLPIGAILMVFHNEILLHWVGAEFMMKSGSVLAIFGAGIVFNSLAQIPNAALQALERPDIFAKLVLMELPFYAVMLWFLTGKLGIEGTAAAWAFRVTLETIILLLAVSHLMKDVRSKTDKSFIWKAILIVAVGLGSTVLVRTLAGDFIAIIVLILALISYAALVWYLLLDHSDRQIVHRLVPSFSRA